MSVTSELTIELRRDQSDRVRQIAARQGRSPSEVVQDALDRFLTISEDDDAFAVWRRHLRWIKARAAAIPGGSRRRTWTREELHDR